MPLHLGRRDFLARLGAIAVIGASTAKVIAEERVFGIRRLHRNPASGVAFSGIAFPAIAASSLPEILVLGHAASGESMRGGGDLEEKLARSGYVELRRYRFESEKELDHARGAFAKGGIQPLLTGENGTFVFGFETLSSREKAWRELSGLGFRASLEDLAIYRVEGHLSSQVQPGGRIFDMSL